MALDGCAIHVLGVNGDVTLAHERLAQQRTMSIPKRELSVGLQVCVSTHVDRATNDHLPQNVTFDKRPTVKPHRQRFRYRRLASGLSPHDNDSPWSCLHLPIIPFGGEPPAGVSAESLSGFRAQCQRISKGSVDRPIVPLTISGSIARSTCGYGPTVTRDNPGQRRKDSDRRLNVALVDFDSSALVKLVLDEVGSDIAAASWNACDVALSSRLAYPEVCAAMAAAERNQHLTASEAAAVASDWELMALRSAVGRARRTRHQR